MLAVALLIGCGEEEGSFCEAGTLDCTCHPALATGCDEGLVCDETDVCVAESE